MVPVGAWALGYDEAGARDGAGVALSPRVRGKRRLGTFFPRGKGIVFHAGTREWVAGLIADDPFVERITRNVLDRFLE